MGFWEGHWGLGEPGVASRFDDLTAEQVRHAVPGATGGTDFGPIENRVFDFGAVVAKFYRPGRWSEAAIAEEHAFVYELAEAGLPVVETIGPPVRVDGMWCAIFPKVAGAIVPIQEHTDGQLRELGRTLARMHVVGERRVPRHRPRLEPSTFGGENLRCLEIPEPIRGDYVKACETLIALSEPMFRDAPMGRVHGDFYPANALWTSRGLRVIDFDDMMVAPAAQDIALLLKLDGVDRPREVGVVLEGYREVRPFDDLQRRLLAPLRGLRRIWYDAGIEGRWHDRRFREEFPDFRTVGFWERRLALQRATIDQIREGARLA